MIKFNTKLLRTVLWMVAFVFGFGATVVAQYGAIQTSYKVKGCITDSETNLPLAKIKISSNDLEYLFDDAITDVNGNFEIETYYLLFNKPLHLQASDSSGRKSLGRYITKDTSFVLMYQDFLKSEPKGGWAMDKIYRYEVNLKLRKELPLVDSLLAWVVRKKIMKDLDTSANVEIKPEPQVELQPADLLGIEPFETAVADTQDTFQDIEIYPNPTNTVIHIIIDAKTNEKLVVDLLDNNAKLLLKNEIGIWVGLNQHEIDLENYPAGNYLLVITQAEKRIVKKIIKL
ncbi:MAG: T9SS type A sorting domain-containing protein [Bacteroidota bacterium]